MSKPRKKKSNKFASVIAKNYLVAWSVGYKEPLFFSLSGKPVLVSPAVKSDMMRLPFPWFSLCIVLCRTQDGEPYLQNLPIKSNLHYPYSALAETLDEKHRELLISSNTLHVLNTGWIASPAGKDISDEVADKIMTSLGAWEYATNYEHQTREGNNEDMS